MHQYHLLDLMLALTLTSASIKPASNQHQMTATCQFNTQPIAASSHTRGIPQEKFLS
jgi:hypothetical protein